MSTLRRLIFFPPEVSALQRGLIAGVCMLVAILWPQFLLPAGTPMPVVVVATAASVLVLFALAIALLRRLHPRVRR
ncbi:MULTISPECIES: hypothetical protein [Pseudonocardia]|uniref:Uncharacterized protein n=1 Tax=Pseudonocardia alni subsp. carboxydivorans TaxID=415010 RepID=A0ABU9ANV9_PSEA5|nr:MULTISPECIES: hypothetical protein [unclassified Pseudonocardia]ANY10829.1 hypothetical protein AFB00_31035 [Pseudonocardia sp. HH130630-07]